MQDQGGVEEEEGTNQIIGYVRLLLMAANWQGDRPRQEDNGLPRSDQCRDPPHPTSEVDIVYRERVTANITQRSKLKNYPKNQYCDRPHCTTQLWFVYGKRLRVEI